jgi:hypothetical protein
MGQTETKEAEATAEASRCTTKTRRQTDYQIPIRPPPFIALHPISTSLIIIPCFLKYARSAAAVDENELAMFDRTFQDLAARSTVDGKKNNKAIDKINFLRLFKLPGMLGERVFDVFDQCVQNSA